MFVGDNTDQINWGGRAQSLALAALLRERFDLTGSIPGRVVAGGGPYVRTVLPSIIVQALAYRRERARLFDWVVRLEERLGARDFITGDPGESADNVLTYASRHAEIGLLLHQVQRADLVVVNGEGSGIFSTPHRRDFFFYLALAELGLRLGKPVFFVNTIFSDCPLTGRNTESVAAAEAVLRRCTDVHARDAYSVEYAAETMPRVRCRHVPDALFTWFDTAQRPDFVPPAFGDFAIPFPEDPRWIGGLDFSKPYVCVAGSSLTASDQERAVPHFRHLVGELTALGLPIHLLQTCGGDRFLGQVAEETGMGFVPGCCPIFIGAAILANAQVLVSGRFHPSILASLRGTPCVFLEARAHKIRSLRDSLGYVDQPVYSAFPSQEEAVRIREQVREILAASGSRDDVRVRIREQARDRAREAAATARLIEGSLDR